MSDDFKLPFRRVAADTFDLVDRHGSVRLRLRADLRFVLVAGDGTETPASDADVAGRLGALLVAHATGQELAKEEWRGRGK